MGKSTILCCGYCYSIAQIAFSGQQEFFERMYKYLIMDPKNKWTFL